MCPITPVGSTSSIRSGSCPDKQVLYIGYVHAILIDPQGMKNSPRHNIGFRVRDGFSIHPDLPSGRTQAVDGIHGRCGKPRLVGILRQAGCSRQRLAFLVGSRKTSEISIIGNRGHKGDIGRMPRSSWKEHFPGEFFICVACVSTCAIKADKIRAKETTVRLKCRLTRSFIRFITPPHALGFFSW
jgi:hypothetical protein